MFLLWEKIYNQQNKLNQTNKMTNPLKNKLMKSIWFKDEKEYKSLVNAIETNESEIVKDIIYEIYLRGDL